MMEEVGIDEGGWDVYHTGSLRVSTRALVLILTLILITNNNPAWFIFSLDECNRQAYIIASHYSQSTCPTKFYVQI